MHVPDRDFGYLWDILDAAKAIKAFTKDKSLDEFIQDEILQAAVERKLEIIGEAARNISKNFKRKYSKLPWHQLVGQRNFIVHEYGRVDHHIIWRIVRSGIPELIRLVKPLLPSIDETEF